MDNRLTFYKITSPYKEDNTKECGLLSSDIDSNFMSLKEYDIKEGYLIKGDTPETQENTFLILKRVGNEVDNTISIDLTSLIPDPTVIDLDGYVKDLTFEYDQNKGLIIIKHNDSEQIISGLSTIWNNQAVFSNETIDGNGTISNPLKISPVYLTGTYAPCISLIDETISGTSLPTSGMNYGDRYLTKEKFYKEGYYYNAQQMEEINAYLSSNNSGWRIPTKADWDNILNAAETCEANRNHTTTEINDENIGFISGKRLKSIEGWSAITINNNLSENKLLTDTTGTDDFGFTVLPVGQGSLYNEIVDDYGSAAYFWTSTKQSPTEAYYTKEFYTNEPTVIQGINQKNGYNSIRLVRDINNGDVSPVEEIDGHLYPTVTMPSLIENKISNGSGGTITEWTSGSSVWTQTNLCGKFNLLVDPIQPLNSGETVYFVNYWNGNKWQRNELKEGFTVVLHNGFDNTKENEYRVVNGELINTSEIVYDKVIERLSGTTFSNIYAKISANTEDINEIKVSLLDNYSTITSAISVINEISSGLRSDINSVSGKLDTFSAQTITFENNITSALSQEITARQDEGQILSGAINDNREHLINDGIYDNENGLLTLNTNNSANTITINLTSNYGIYPNRNY